MRRKQKKKVKTGDDKNNSRHKSDMTLIGKKIQ